MLTLRKLEASELNLKVSSQTILNLLLSFIYITFLSVLYGEPWMKMKKCVIFKNSGEMHIVVFKSVNMTDKNRIRTELMHENWQNEIDVHIYYV